MDYATTIEATLITKEWSYLFSVERGKLIFYVHICIHQKVWAWKKERKKEISLNLGNFVRLL